MHQQMLQRAEARVARELAGGFFALGTPRGPLLFFLTQILDAQKGDRHEGLFVPVSFSKAARQALGYKTGDAVLLPLPLLELAAGLFRELPVAVVGPRETIDAFNRKNRTEVLAAATWEKAVALLRQIQTAPTQIRAYTLPGEPAALLREMADVAVTFVTPGMLRKAGVAEEVIARMTEGMLVHRSA